MKSKLESYDFIWWKHGVIYHIYPKSFSDSNHDGIGDLNGIREKLPYLKDLGVDAIWLSPIYLSPMFDQGYDIQDYREIDPAFGTMSDFKRLLASAKALGIRLIMDLVMNHTSQQHPWFQSALNDKHSLTRDYYIWQDGKQNGLPNNWRTAFGGSAWEYEPKSKQYYLHSFLKEQPDLNWRNKDLQRVFFDEIRFWLDLGVDGFRLDVINMIGKDKNFRNNPRWLAFFQKSIFNINRGRSYKIVRKLRDLINQYDNRMLVGEIYTLPPGNSSLAASYLGHGDDLLHLAFDFSLLFKRFNARSYYQTIRNWLRLIPKKGWPCFVLSNHDLMRHITRLGTGERQLSRAKVVATLLLTLKGTPFIYYGEEIGMQNGSINKSDLVDPLGKKYWPIYTGRDKARTPMQWDTTIFAGFSNHKPWLPFSEIGGDRNVESQQKNKNSLFNHYKTLIHMRKEQPVLTRGKIRFIEKGDSGVLGFIRSFNAQSMYIYTNFTSKNRECVWPTTKSITLLYSSEANRKLGEKLVLKPFESLLFI